MKKIGIIFFLVLIFLSIANVQANNESIEQDIDTNLNEINEEDIVKINDEKTDTKLSANDTTMYYLNGNYTVYLRDLEDNPLDSKILDIEFGDNSYKMRTDGNGMVNLNIRAEPGIYNITTTFEGDDSFNGQSIVNKLTILSTINASNVIKYYLDNTTFQAVLSDYNGNPLKNNSAYAEIYNENNKTVLSTITDNNGLAIFNLNQFPGDYFIRVHSTPYAYEIGRYNLTILYNGSSFYSLNGNNITLYYRNGTKYIVSLTDKNGTPLINETIFININGKDYNDTTNDEGIVSLEIDFDAGNYTAMVYYNQTDLEIIYNSITVLPTLKANGLIKYFGNNTPYEVIALDSKGNLLKNTDIKITVNGKDYIRKTDDDGIARLNVNLNPNTYFEIHFRYYPVIVTNPNDDYEFWGYIQILPTIEGENLSKIYKENKSYSVKVLDIDGSPLKNAEVIMNVNGVLYKRTSDDEGIARLNINLLPGNYIITAEHPDGTKVTNSIYVSSPIWLTHLTMNYSDGSKYEAFLPQKIGESNKNQKVLFTVNDITYERYSDDEGYARLNINLDPGHYHAFAEYDGIRQTTDITVN